MICVLARAGAAKGHLLALCHDSPSDSLVLGQPRARDSIAIPASQRKQLGPEAATTCPRTQWFRSGQGSTPGASIYSGVEV